MSLFIMKTVNTGGPDPYAGDVWTARLGDKRGRFGEIEFTFGNVVIYEARLEWMKYGDDPRKARLPSGYRKLLHIVAMERHNLPWVLRKLWAVLSKQGK
jgi:hypothetical protein